MVSGSISKSKELLSVLYAALSENWMMILAVLYVAQTVELKWMMEKPMKNRTCTVRDCPDTHLDIISRLCGIMYPYGGAVCRHMFERWYKEEQEVRDLHELYLRDKKGENKK